MRVLFLTSGHRTPSTRFRILPYIQYLQDHGIHCRVASSFPQKYDYFPWMGFRPSQKLKRLTRWIHLLEAKLRSFDVLYLEREIFDDDSVEMEQRFRQCVPKLIYDLDDALFLRRPEKVETLTRMSDLVVAGNPQIETVLAEWQDKSHVIPTTPSVSVFKPIPRSPARDVPVIGWIGTSGNVAYLAVVAEALREVSRRCSFELRLIAPDLNALKDIDLAGVQVRHLPWDGDREASQVADFDIGIMPLFAGQEWDRYKCPTKLTQYMACGLPAVVSPVGFTAEVLEHEVTGFHASTTEEWVSALQQLLRSEQLRREMGIKARQRAEQVYSVEANAPRLLAAIRNAASDQ